MPGSLYQFFLRLAGQDKIDIQLVLMTLLYSQASKFIAMTVKETYINLAADAALAVVSQVELLHLPFNNGNSYLNRGIYINRNLSAYQTR